jgi:hypothetical protein
MPKDIALSGDAFPAVSDRGSLQFSGVHFCSPCYFALRFSKIGQKIDLAGKDRNPIRSHRESNIQLQSNAPIPQSARWRREDRDRRFHQ